MRRARVLTSIAAGLLLGSHSDAFAGDANNLWSFFNSLCWKQVTYLPTGNARFAPVEEIPQSARRDGFGIYRLRQPGYQHAKVSSRSGMLSFVSALDPPSGEGLPRHLWHVISVPRPGKSWDGLIANSRAAVKAEAISMQDYEFLSRASAAPASLLRGSEPGLLYNWAVDSEKQQVLDRWVSILGAPIMNAVVSPNESYDHQFYFVEVPKQSRLVTKHSWLWPSSRTVWATGMAFGFVLDDRGECIGKDSIEIVP